MNGWKKKKGEKKKKATLMLIRGIIPFRVRKKKNSLRREEYIKKVNDVVFVIQSTE